MTTETQYPQPAHTPGPWHWEDGKEFMNMPHLMAGDVVVCHFGDDTRYYSTEGTPPSYENKRLIAAAPELLEALRGMLTLDRENNQRGHDDEDVCAEVQAARDAIAKATGAQA